MPDTPIRISRRQLIAGSMAGAAFSRAAMAQSAQGRRVAVTLDDGPVAGDTKDMAVFEKITAGLMGALMDEKVPATVFLNERQLNVQGQRDARAAVVAKWLDAGFNVGNHTYSHPSANRVPVWEFTDNITRGEVVTTALLEERGRKLEWFRYPFLDSGKDAASHQAIVDFLEQRKYKVGHITVDYKDYVFAGVYGRAMRDGNQDIAAKVKQAYLDEVDVGFDDAEKLSKTLYGYELPQILLVHCNELNSVILRDAIAKMRKRGYSFITIDEAVKDPAYARPDTFAGGGGSWLERTAIAMGKEKEIPADIETRLPKWLTEYRGRRRP